MADEQVNTTKEEADQAILNAIKIAADRVKISNSTTAANELGTTVKSLAEAHAWMTSATQPH